MDWVLGGLLVLLGVSLWVLAGLLPTLKLDRDADGTVSITPQLTWMGALVLWQQRIPDVQGARLARDPEQADRSRVELLTPKGRVPLTGAYTGSTTPERLSRVIDRFAHDSQVPPARLPLRGRMSLMLTFGILFPLGTICMVAGVALLFR